MPVKRRIDKRRPAGPPASAFEAMFQGGHDFFGELEPFGITDDPQDLESRAAIRQGWAQHGAAFMAGHPPGSPRPWAFAQWGDPGA